MTLPPLPEPDTHCFDNDTGLDVWSHSPDQMRAYGEACTLAERERCLDICEQHYSIEFIAQNIAAEIRGPNVRGNRETTHDKA